MITCNISSCLTSSAPIYPFLSKNSNSMYALFSSTSDPRLILCTGIYASYVNNGFDGLACIESSTDSLVVTSRLFFRTFNCLWYVVNFLFPFFLNLLFMFNVLLEDELLQSEYHSSFSVEGLSFFSS